jgi:PAS domain S-box-containing protein
VPDAVLFEALLRSAPDPILISDQGGRIVTASAQVKQVFGYEPAELLGKPVEVLLPERLERGHRDHRAHYYQSPSTRPMGKGLNLSALRRDGTEFPAEISLSHLETENGILVMAIVRDVTDRKDADRLRDALTRLQERERMQMDLHDSVIGAIYAATLQLETCLDDTRLVPGTSNALNETIDGMHRVINEIRDHILSQEPVVDQPSLESALTRLAAQFTATTGIPAGIESPADPPTPADPQLSAAFHVVQEALNNIAKHAKPSEVVVRVATTSDEVRIEVIDDGTGFDVFVSQTPEHHGLRNMTERARGAGGTLSIRSLPGQGTTVTLQFPL